ISPMAASRMAEPNIRRYEGYRTLMGQTTARDAEVIFCGPRISSPRPRRMGGRRKTSVVSAKIMALIGRGLSQAEPIRILGAVPKSQDFHASSRFIDAIKDQVGP